MHKTIRIIATDLDGTMLHHDNEVSVRNYRAIEHAVNEGMLYVVATGRCRSIVPISNLPVMDYLIAENGAVIYRGGTEQVLYRQAISCLCGTCFRWQNPDRGGAFKTDRTASSD